MVKIPSIVDLPVDGALRLLQEAVIAILRKSPACYLGRQTVGKLNNRVNHFTSVRLKTSTRKARG